MSDRNCKFHGSLRPRQFQLTTLIMIDGLALQDPLLTSFFGPFRYFTNISSGPLHLCLLMLGLSVMDSLVRRLFGSVTHNSFCYIIFLYYLIISFLNDTFLVIIFLPISFITLFITYNHIPDVTLFSVVLPLSPVIILISSYYHARLFHAIVCLHFPAPTTVYHLPGVAIFTQ